MGYKISKERNIKDVETGVNHILLLNELTRDVDRTGMNLIYSDGVVVRLNGSKDSILDIRKRYAFEMINAVMEDDNYAFYYFFIHLDKDGSSTEYSDVFSDLASMMNFILNRNDDVKNAIIVSDFEKETGPQLLVGYAKKTDCNFDLPQVLTNHDPQKKLTLKYMQTDDLQERREKETTNVEDNMEGKDEIKEEEGKRKEKKRKKKNQDPIDYMDDVVGVLNSYKYNCTQLQATLFDCQNKLDDDITKLVKIQQQITERLDRFDEHNNQLIKRLFLLGNKKWFVIAGLITYFLLSFVLSVGYIKLRYF